MNAIHSRYPLIVKTGGTSTVTSQLEMEKQLKLANGNVAQPVSQGRQDAMRKHLASSGKLLSVLHCGIGFQPAI